MRAASKVGWLLPACAIWLAAQSPQATVSGVVRDPQGAVIPGVAMAAVHQDTGVKSATRTNEAGFYSLQALPIGRDTLTAELAGFRRHTRQGLEVTTGHSLELNVTLGLGAVTESVTVSARASLLETRTSEASQLVESQTIEDMPLGDRRAMNLIEITGAAVFVDYDTGSKPNFALAGGRTQSQMFWIDGGTGQNMRIGIGQIDIDPPVVVGPGHTGRQYRPFPQFSNVSIIGPSLGVSSYHASVVKAEKRFRHGFNLLATYTWSKFLDNCAGGGSTLGDEGSPYSNFYNRRADWGPSENDLRHRFTWSSVYQMPIGRGRRYPRGHQAARLLDGWSVGSVLVMQSAPPFTVRTQTNTTCANSAGALRADVIRDPNLPPAQRTLGRWFDTDAFRQPPDYQFGNQGINLVRADGSINLNCSIIRTFRVAERKQLQFRGEFFNLPNHPDFGLPARVFEGPGFGIVSSARKARQVQVGLRLTFRNPSVADQTSGFAGRRRGARGGRGWR